MDAKNSLIKTDTQPLAVVRYERVAPGELLHIDIKTLGKFARTGHRVISDPQQGKSRGAGWEFVHVCVDYHSLESQR